MTDRYALFGHPISHSKSPLIHTLFAQQTEQTLTYQAIDAPPDRFPQLLRDFIAEGGKGANITLPHKETLLTLVDRATERARLAGAANTLLIAPDGALIADNTDGVGLIRDLTHRHGVLLRRARILLLGAGGAARGILPALLEQQPHTIALVNRTPERAQTLLRHFTPLAQRHQIHLIQLPWEILYGSSLPSSSSPFDLILNATSAGLTGEPFPLPPTLAAPHTIAYDLLYGPEPTPFLRAAQRLGLGKTFDGLGMLIEQAAESFTLWRGLRPLTDPVYHALRHHLTHP
ncbi:MAG: shikimate dehydrogenase [Hydrogenophilus sp.]|nr:shikimate dehydrogenase [Hydrogenophilus sp.]